MHNSAITGTYVLVLLVLGLFHFNIHNKAVFLAMTMPVSALQCLTYKMKVFNSCTFDLKCCFSFAHPGRISSKKSNACIEIICITMQTLKCIRICLLQQPKILIVFIHGDCGNKWQLTATCKTLIPLT